MSTHTLTLRDPITGSDQPVAIVIHRSGDQWRYTASFGETALAHGENLWFEREEDVLALAQERAREAMRGRDPRAFKA